MKFKISTPDYIVGDEKLVFNIIDYYSLLNRIKDSNNVVEDKLIINTIKNYVLNLKDIKTEILKQSEKSKHMSVLRIENETTQNHIIFLTSYIKSVLYDYGLIDRKGNRIMLKNKIEISFKKINILIDNAFEWLDFIKVSNNKIDLNINNKYKKVLNKIVSLINLIIKGA